MRRWSAAVIVLAVCAAVYLPWLGRGGLTYTEGHRAIPGWEMLESRNWQVPTLFGKEYLRKPPGVPWAIAASSKVWGETEFAARLPSALAMTGMSLVAMFFAWRWFGHGAGLVAGLAAALTPWFWSSGRSAEIEAINNFFSCAGVLLVLELLVNRGARRWPVTAAFALLLSIAMVGTLLAKGPAGFAAIGAAAVVGMILVGTDCAEQRSVARVRSWLWLSLAIGGPALVAWVIWGPEGWYSAERIKRETGQDPVVQSVTEFLWSAEKLTAAGIRKVVMMPVAALAAGLPGTAALALALWKRNGTGETPVPRGERMARAVGWTCLLTLAILVVLGVGNHRYAMPAVSFVPVLAGYAFARVPLRAIVLVAGALLVGAAVWIGVQEPRMRAKSGREAGIAMGAALADGAMMWGDQMVESRPETLWYAKQEAARRGVKVRPVWVPGMSAGPFLPREGYLLLRDDEEAVYLKEGLRLTKVWSGRVHKYDCALYRKD